MCVHTNPKRILDEYEVELQVKSDDGTHHLLVSKFFGVEDRAEVIVDDVTVTARKYALLQPAYSQQM